MATLKMTDRHKAMAYVLNKEFGYSMSKISNLMGVAQSTISNAIKDFEYQRVIRNLEFELREARESLSAKGFVLPNIELKN